MDTCNYCFKSVRCPLIYTRQYDTRVYTAHTGCRAKHLGMSTIEFILRAVLTDDASLHSDVFNWDDSFMEKPRRLRGKEEQS